MEQKRVGVEKVSRNLLRQQQPSSGIFLSSARVFAARVQCDQTACCELRVTPSLPHAQLFPLLAFELEHGRPPVKVEMFKHRILLLQARQEHWSGLPFPSPELGIFLITYGHHCKHAVLCCDSVMPCRALGMQSGLFSPTCNTVIQSKGLSTSLSFKKIFVKYNTQKTEKHKWKTQ